LGRQHLTTASISALVMLPAMSIDTSPSSVTATAGTSARTLAVIGRPRLAFAV
jgi:hypothetical protein